MNEFYHISILAANLQNASPSASAANANVSSGGFAGPYCLGIATSLLATIIASIAVVAAKRGIGPAWAAVRSFLRLHATLGSINMHRFNRSREDYALNRRGAATISAYVSSAKVSLQIVSFSLVTGIQFEELCTALRFLLERAKPVDIDISLLDPRLDQLMQAIAPSYTMKPDVLVSSIHTTIEHLFALKNDLSPSARNHLKIHVHRAIPLGSAILIDAQQPTGRIQIETKAYRTGLGKSWGFELRAGGKHDLYQTLVNSYRQLVIDGEELTGIL